MTDNLGRMLRMTRQDNKVGLKHLIVLYKKESVNESLKYVVDRYRELLYLKNRDILYLD